MTIPNWSPKKMWLPVIGLLWALNALGQNDLPEEAKKNVAEGKLLYKLEMASWYGTDLFVENYKEKENVKGYFSYFENKTTKCIFFSKSVEPKVIGTITFDSTYNPQTAKIDLAERTLNETEATLHKIREIALKEVNTDTLFKKYKNTNLNLIPLVDGNERKVYVLTGPKVNGLVIFGNDYLLTFDQENQLQTKKSLHKSLIPVYYNNNDSTKVTEAMHTQLPKTGPFMTATDVCTLMLYAKFTNWKQYSIMSSQYLNIWDCRTNELTVIHVDALEKIRKHQESKKKAKN
jgi:hypothetical protein